MATATGKRIKPTTPPNERSTSATEVLFTPNPPRPASTQSAVLSQLEKSEKPDPVVMAADAMKWQTYGQFVLLDSRGELAAKESKQLTKLIEELGINAGHYAADLSDCKRADQLQRAVDDLPTIQANADKARDLRAFVKRDVVRLERESKAFATMTAALLARTIREGEELNKLQSSKPHLFVSQVD